MRNVRANKKVADKLREWESLLSNTIAHEPNATPTILSDGLIETVCSARLYSWMRSDEEERLEGIDDETLLEIEEFSQLSDTAMRAVLSQGKASKSWPEAADLSGVSPEATHRSRLCGANRNFLPGSDLCRQAALAR